MFMKKLVTAFFLLMIVGSVTAQNRLVTRQEINQRIQDGYFMQRLNTTIASDNRCIDATEAKQKLYLDDAALPTDGHVPWYSELLPWRTVPCSGGTIMCAENHAEYGACGAYIYNQGFNNSLTVFTRARLANGMWQGDATQCTRTPSTTGPGGARVSAVSLNGATLKTAVDSQIAYVREPDTTLMQAKSARTQAAAIIAGVFNGCAMWACNMEGVTTQWFYFERTINVPATKTYYMGIAADNAFRFSINGWKVLEYGKDEEAYRIWHIFPIELGAGIQTLRFECLNTGLNAAFGVEFYDNTAAEIKNATSRSNLKIIYSTSDRTNSVICR